MIIRRFYGTLYEIPKVEEHQSIRRKNKLGRKHFVIKVHPKNKVISKSTGNAKKRIKKNVFEVHNYECLSLKI